MIATDSAATDRLISLDAAAARLGIRRTKTNELVFSGELKSLKIGHRRLISSASVDDFIARAFRQSEAALKQ